MKIGILGGTFHPIHKGHLYAAKAAQEALSLDRVLIMPAGDPPHKDEITTITRYQRFELVRESLANADGLEFFPFEFSYTGPGYSYIILGELKKRFPKDELWFIIGEDSLLAFDTWVRPDVITQYVNLAVIPRKDGGGMNRSELSAVAEKKAEKYGTDVRIVDCPPFDASSTEIRRLLYGRKSADEVPAPLNDVLADATLAFIQKHRLYEAFPICGEEPFDFAAAEEKLAKKLSPHRLRHSLGVCDTAAALAARYGYPVYYAKIAGLLHDCAKGLSEEKYFKICGKHGIPVTEAERKAPYLLHAKVGALYAEKKFGVTDPELLQAIRVHTTGEPAMSLLGQILFISDYIEPGRDKAAELEEIRELAYVDLDLCCRVILDNTLAYLKASGADVDPLTEKTAAYYRKAVADKRAEDHFSC